MPAPEPTTPTHAPLPRTAAVVLTGGTGARLGGVDKAALTVDGQTLLDLALVTVAATARTVVVGPAAPTRRPVDFVVEDPPSGGPAAGLLAALDHLDATSEVPLDWIVVLAVDMPRVSGRTVARLHAAASTPPSDGAVLVDGDGRAQLCAVVRRSALEGVRPDAPATGWGFFRLVGDLDLVAVASVGDESLDVDTWDDLDRVTGPDPGGVVAEARRTLDP